MSATKAVNDAGSRAARDRLIRIVRESQLKYEWSEAWDRAWSLIRLDTDLVCTLFEPYRQIALRQVMEEVRAKLQNERRKAKDNAKRKFTEVPNSVRSPSARAATDVGQHLGASEGQDTRAPSVASVAEVGGGRATSDADGGGHDAFASDGPYPHAPAAPQFVKNILDLQQEEREQARLKAESLLRGTMLYRFDVNGKVLADQTPEEARRWAGTQRDRARFIELVTANLPNGVRIGDYIKDPVWVDEMWKRAREMSNE